MVEQEIGIEFPVPKPGNEICKFCTQGYSEELGPLHFDVVIGYFHQNCFNENISQEFLKNISPEELKQMEEKRWNNLNNRK